MQQQQSRSKRREWLRRYLPAEVLATALSVIVAAHTFSVTHSFAAAAAAGWVGEGIGFYGYMVLTELRLHAAGYRRMPVLRRAFAVIAASSTNLLVEFLPAELLDNFIIRPLAFYIVPQHVQPYAAGFLVAKFSADIVFYGLAIIGYETRRRWLPAARR